MEYPITVPVLLVAFNRPDTTRTVFQKIREAKPQKLYVTVDGPREEKDGEVDLVNKVKAIVQDVDWNCKTYYLFHEKNLGAEVTVSSAISWAFENEEYAIILEDDIVAPLSFFRFSNDMLIKYKDDERIATVTGCNFTPIKTTNNEDYFFANYGHSWGWGTWKRNWEMFDLNAEVSDEHLKKDFLKKITNSKAEMNYYRKFFKRIKQNGPGNSTWDQIGFYVHRVKNSLSIIPRVNLTTNIGIYGLHAKGLTEHHFRPYDENFVVRKSPIEVIRNIEYDKHHFRTYINRKKSLYQRIIHGFSRKFNLYYKRVKNEKDNKSIYKSI
jgi:GR25 family glycosyltransferase involved in LPS biosynthesis